MRFSSSSFCLLVQFELIYFPGREVDHYQPFLRICINQTKNINSHLCALSMISTQSSPTFTFDFLRWHANRRVNQTFIWRGFFLDLLQVCISIFSNFIPIWFWHLYEVPLSHGAQEKEPKVRSVHTVSFDWFLSGLEWILNLEFCLLKLLIFYQKLLWNIRSRLNSSTFWVFRPVFRYVWSKLKLCAQNMKI